MTHGLKAGDTFAGMVNTWHRLREGPPKIVVVSADEVGTPLSVPKGGKPGE
jgi:ribosomal protein L30E